MKTKVSVNRVNRVGFSCQAGFTLIELLVAIAILGAALSPLVTAYVTSWKASMQAERNTRAITLATWKIDQILAKETYESVSNETGNFGTDWGLSRLNIYDYEVTTSDVTGDHANFEAKEVRLTVEYQNIFSNTPRTIRCTDPSSCDYDFVFQISEKGPAN